MRMESGSSFHHPGLMAWAAWFVYATGNLFETLLLNWPLKRWSVCLGYAPPVWESPVKDERTDPNAGRPAALLICNRGVSNLLQKMDM